MMRTKGFGCIRRDAKYTVNWRPTNTALMTRMISFKGTPLGKKHNPALVRLFPACPLNYRNQDEMMPECAVDKNGRTINFLLTLHSGEKGRYGLFDK